MAMTPSPIFHVPREAEIRQLKQQLLNITLRLRAAYVARSLREEQLAILSPASSVHSGSAAAALLELEGQPATSPQQAFELPWARTPVARLERGFFTDSDHPGGALIPSGAAHMQYFVLEFARLVTATR